MDERLMDLEMTMQVHIKEIVPALGLEVWAVSWKMRLRRRMCVAMR
jgi:hypothetical protein